MTGLTSGTSLVLWHVGGNMPRRPNYRFVTPANLEEMARSLEAAAQNLRYSSIYLERSGQEKVALGHLTKIEDCGKAVQLILLELQRKLLLSSRQTVGREPELSTKTPPDMCECSLVDNVETHCCKRT